VNRVLDKAVAVAVQTYSGEKVLEIQQQREEHLSFIVHDLKTPLAAVSIAANILDQALPYQCKDERVSRMMELVHRNTLRLNALISRVLRENTNIYAARETGGGFPAKVEVRELDLWPLPRLMKAGDFVYVPRGTIHRNQNLSKSPARSIELNITDKDKPQTEQVP
jgi:signal transduction histidine kinase